MRCSLGRHREEATLQVSDEELVEVVLHDLADAIGLSVRPVDSPRPALGRGAAAVRRGPPRPGSPRSGARSRAARAGGLRLGVRRRRASPPASPPPTWPPPRSSATSRTAADR